MKQYVAYTANGLVGVDAKDRQIPLAVRKDQGAEGDEHPHAGRRRGTGLQRRRARRRRDGASSSADQRAVKAERSTSMQAPAAIGGAVLVGEYLYGTSGADARLRRLQDRPGQVVRSKRGPGRSAAADGRLYLHGENGEVALVEATPEAYRELGRFTPPNPPERANQMEKAWAYPVIADGRLYIRDTDCLWCYDIKDPAAGAAAAPGK